MDLQIPMCLVRGNSCTREIEIAYIQHATVIVCHDIILKVVMDVLRSTWISNTPWLS